MTTEHPIYRYPAATSISEDDARNVLGAALEALRWARTWREHAQAESGPKTGAAKERWDWYCQGSDSAARHDLHCLEEELRLVLGLPAPGDGADVARWTPEPEETHR